MTDAVNYERLLGRVDSIVEKQTELAAQLKELATTLETRYVPRELYESQREGDRQDVRDINRRLDTAEANRTADRRLILTAFVAPFVVALLLIYVAAQIGGSPA